MPSFKSQFSQFPRFIQQGGVVYPPEQMPPQMPQQQIPPQMPPVPPPFVPPARKSPLKAILLTLLALVILSGAGFAAALGTRIWDPMWNPFRPKPEVVFNQARLKMNDIKKYKYNASGTFSLRAIGNDSKEGNFEATIASNGAIDITDILNPKLDSILNFALSASGSGEKMGASSFGEVKVKDSALYFKITKLEASGLAQEDLIGYIASFNNIKDQWVKITKEELQSMGSQNNENIPEEKQKELEAQISAIFEKYPVWKIDSQLADEKSGSIDVYHYVVAINKENLKKAFSESMKASADMGDSLGQTNATTDYFFSVVEGFANTFFDKIGEVKADIWIGKKDLLVYQVDFKKDVDLKELTGMISGNLGIKLNLKLSDHNQPIDVSVPSETKSYDEVFGPFIRKSQNEAKNAKIQADMQQIRTTAEIINSEKKSYSTVNCKEKDIGLLCADIKTQSGEEPKVFGYYKKYCAYAKLLKLSDSDKQEYYCLDYNLSAIKTDIDPSQKGYCTGYTFECPKPSIMPSPSPIM